MTDWMSLDGITKQYLDALGLEPGDRDLDFVSLMQRARGDRIAGHEKADARAAFDRAILVYERVAEEAL